MAVFKLFGCTEFYTGGKIIAVLTLLENCARCFMSLVFLWWVASKPSETVTEKGGEWKRFQSEVNENNLSVFTEIINATIYACAGLVGIALSVLLIHGISQKRHRLLIPWICFQFAIICHQVYFSCEIIKYEASEYVSLIFLTIFMFHTVFEAYYLCVIIGLSQVIANMKVIECHVGDVPLKYVPDTSIYIS